VRRGADFATRQEPGRAVVRARARTGGAAVACGRDRRAGRGGPGSAALRASGVGRGDVSDISRRGGAGIAVWRDGGA
jgi:hypothetical protein